MQSNDMIANLRFNEKTENGKLFVELFYDIPLLKVTRSVINPVENGDVNTAKENAVFAAGVSAEMAVERARNGELLAAAVFYYHNAIEPSKGE